MRWLNREFPSKTTHCLKWPVGLDEHLVRVAKFSRRWRHDRPLPDQKPFAALQCLADVIFADEVLRLIGRKGLGLRIHAGIRLRCIGWTESPGGQERIHPSRESLGRDP